MSNAVKSLLVFVTVLFAACATTTPVVEWRSPEFKDVSFDDILIIGVSNDNAARRIFEDTFVAELKKLGVTAVSSHSIMAEGQKITRENVEAAIKGNKIHAVLVTHLVGVETRESYTPPTYRPAPMMGGYYGYYSHVYTYVYEPGYYTRYKVLKLETNLYDTATSKLVWSTQSESVEASNAKKLIDSKIKATIKQLKKQQLI